MLGICFLKSSVHVIFFCFYAEQGDEGDSNLLPGDHEVLSGVFREEFGAANAENKAKYKEDLSNSIENYLVSTEAVTRDSDTEVSNMRRGRSAYILYPLACFFSLQEKPGSCRYIALCLTTCCKNFTRIWSDFCTS